MNGDAAARPRCWRERVSIDATAVESTRPTRSLSRRLVYSWQAATDKAGVAAKGRCVCSNFNVQTRALAHFAPPDLPPGCALAPRRSPRRAMAAVRSLRVRVAPLLLALLALAALPVPTTAARAATVRSLRAHSAPAPTLTLNTTVLDASGDYVTVTWAGVHAPNASDFVALLPDGAVIDALAGADGGTSPVKMKPTGGTRDGSARCAAGRPDLRLWFLWLAQLTRRSRARLRVRAQLPHAQLAHAAAVLPLFGRPSGSRAARADGRRADLARCQRADASAPRAHIYDWRHARAMDDA
jgi:hypothetical protein